MKKLILIVIAAGLSISGYAQNVGLSFSYFIPKNGYVSTPISPFSIRGLGVNLTKHIALETGASLYRMSGLSMKDLPLSSKEPFVGPNFTIFVPGEIVFELKGSNVEFDIKAGGFAFYGFGQKLNYGNIDRAIRELEGWAVANSQLEYKNKPGFGYHAGVELTVYVTSQLGISIETNYLVGQSKLPLTGTYTGGSASLETKSVNYADAKIDFTGLEFSIGLIFNSGGGSKPKRRR
jgi:hypothetical protein